MGKLVKNFMRRREKKEHERAVEQLQMILAKNERSTFIRKEVKMGEKGRKLTHKSKLQSKALWAIFNLYNGEVPEKHCMTKIA